MPEASQTNGSTSNGTNAAMAATMGGDGHTGLEGATGDRFLFTSESVGEGHPGKPKFQPHFFFDG